MGFFFDHIERTQNTMYSPATGFILDLCLWTEDYSVLLGPEDMKVTDEVRANADNLGS